MHVILTVIDEAAPARLMNLLVKRTTLVQDARNALILCAPTDVSPFESNIRRDRLIDVRPPILIHGADTSANQVACFDVGRYSPRPGTIEDTRAIEPTSRAGGFSTRRFGWAGMRYNPGQG